MMRLLYRELISPIMAASVVLLPEPVWPVTSTSPRGRSVSSLTIGGRCRSSIVCTWLGITRNEIAIVSRW